MAADPSTDPQTARLDRTVTWSVIALVAATVLIGALAPRAAHPPAPSAVPASDPARNQSCAEWGDGCKVCRRIGEEIACSLPGIACTPGPETCLRGAGEP
ncbi:hypothetical protein ASF53_16100 [Methylobacterium sp. Leaf123]|uniref:hypothetical protein n=1 Tax=Methylobacterium sp. Leaf123 TaxID=1736264 RepID=UPI0006F724EA|nr:hypothetical protein [Methylobacterium sp. Leaf123]KQQ11700.1 hypothetical protein ASF53_16100 [Methylobacterium sp. Leaf123]